MNILSFLPLMSGAEGEGGGAAQLITLVLIIGVFYVFLILPQRKQQKALKKFREDMKKGDRVVTTGGILGKVADIQEKTITLDVGNSIHFKVDRNSVVKAEQSESVEKK
ncbi:MAG: preprotein translocase subunit YajC [Bacteroidales bacterium]|nr:preprotein translocase subunit YajC [Bacteroidales bacterium]